MAALPALAAAVALGSHAGLAADLIAVPAGSALAAALLALGDRTRPPLERRGIVVRTRRELVCGMVGAVALAGWAGAVWLLALRPLTIAEQPPRAQALAVAAAGIAAGVGLAALGRPGRVFVPRVGMLPLVATSACALVAAANGATVEAALLVVAGCVGCVVAWCAVGLIDLLPVQVASVPGEAAPAAPEGG